MKTVVDVAEGDTVVCGALPDDSSEKRATDDKLLVVATIEKIAPIR